MNYMNVNIPDLNPEGTYYLCNGHGGVNTRSGRDIKIHGHFVTDGDKTEFKVHCTDDCWNIYPVEEVKVKHGTLLAQVPLKCVALSLSWYNHASDENVSVLVNEDLTLQRGVWVCKDYEPKFIRMATDEALILPYNDYLYDCGTFRCEIDSGVFANDQVYHTKDDVRFYCRCHAVSDKSMADHVRLTDEQLAQVNTRVKALMDYCSSQGIALVYDNDYEVIRAYKSENLPKGYEAHLNDCGNDDPQSMTVPQSGLRKIELALGGVNFEWGIHLDYHEPKEDK